VWTQGQVLPSLATVGVLALVDAADLYQRHRNKVYQLCLRLGGGNVGWAEDATQDVFVKLLERLPGLEEPDDLGGWIYRVAVNVCMTRLKRDGSVWRRVRQALLASPPSGGPSPERRVEVKQEVAAALETLGELPAKERVVFCMKHLDGLEQRQIAATLDLSEGYVSKLLHRAAIAVERRGWEAPRD
jgi:RNA polymerase sigma factor (sigma-70 family)